MKSFIQKAIIPGRTQSQDKKFSNQSTMRSMKVRLGHNNCWSLSFQAVVLLTKTAINHGVFLIQSEVSRWI